jgi:hypothetical protein
MVSFRYTLVAATTLLHRTVAQQPSKIVPEDIRAGFSRGEEVQVSYTNDPSNGFTDATSFDKDGE